MLIAYNQRNASYILAAPSPGWSIITISSIIILALCVLCITLLQYHAAPLLFSHFTQLVIVTQQKWSALADYRFVCIPTSAKLGREAEFHPFDIDFMDDPQFVLPLTSAPNPHLTTKLSTVRPPPEQNVIAVQLEKINARRALRMSTKGRPRPRLSLARTSRSPSPLSQRTPLLAERFSTMSPILCSPIDIAL